MKPSIFESSVVLEAPIEEVYAFHGNPHNIARIAPAWQQVQVLRANPIPLAGEDFEIAVRILRLPPLQWRGRWLNAQSPTLLVDEGLQAGPFTFWQHRHQFRALGDDRTEMTDHVTYTFPGGWLGKLASETIGRLQMRLMFADRHKRTRAWFSAPRR